MTKKSKLNGYLVGNYSQYQNALDFKKQEITKGHQYLFVLCTHSKIYQEIKKNHIPADWDRVWIFYNRILIFLTQMQLPILSGYAYLLNEYYVYKKALWVAKKYEFKHFAVGNYFYPTYRSVSNLVKKDEVIILDDGSNIINSIEFLKEGKDNNYLSKTSLGFLLFKNLNLHYHHTITYFGTYRKVKFRGHDRVIFNDKIGKVNDIELIDCAYIIGQKIYNTFIDFNKYILTLKEVIKELDVNKIFYIPHRMESKDDIEKIKNIFEILRPGEPIETFIANQKKSPNHFISYYSSALLNLKLLNLEGVSFHALKAKEIMKSGVGEKLEKVYNYYAAEGINIIMK